MITSTEGSYFWGKGLLGVLAGLHEKLQTGYGGIL